MCELQRPPPVLDFKLGRIQNCAPEVRPRVRSLGHHPRADRPVPILVIPSQFKTLLPEIMCSLIAHASVSTSVAATPCIACNLFLSVGRTLAKEAGFSTCTWASAFGRLQKAGNSSFNLGSRPRFGVLAASGPNSHERFDASLENAARPSAKIQGS